MGYALDLVTLEHVLKQKIALFGQIMEGRSNKFELEVWNQELARVSVNIARHRKEFIEFLNNNLNETYINLSEFTSVVKIVYKGVEAQTPEEFLEKLKRYEDAEIRSGQNLYGPHRDDFVIEKDGKENIYNSSRGELRSQILALKLLQAKYLDQHKLHTIVLLDDVFSELDETRRSRLIKSLSGHQIFITSTEEHHLPAFGGDIKILNVEHDQIKTV
jgi:DNA replication and repair protein RecF